MIDIARVKIRILADEQVSALPEPLAVGEPSPLGGIQSVLCVSHRGSIHRLNPGRAAGTPQGSLPTQGAVYFATKRLKPVWTTSP